MRFEIHGTLSPAFDAGTRREGYVNIKGLFLIDADNLECVDYDDGRFVDSFELPDDIFAPALKLWNVLEGQIGVESIEIVFPEREDWNFHLHGLFGIDHVPSGMFTLS